MSPNRIFGDLEFGLLVGRARQWGEGFMSGLLVTMTEPPPGMEEEFNAWYDTEHLPERLAIPGFRSARRWVARGLPPGEGKYLATYELESRHVLSTPGYLAHVGDHFSPWSKRCLGKAVMFRRWACESISSAGAQSSGKAAFLFLAVGDAPEEYEAEFNQWYDQEHIPLLSAVPGVISARRFKDPDGNPRYLALYELDEASVLEKDEWHAALQTPWFKRMDGILAGCEWILRLYASCP